MEGHIGEEFEGMISSVTSFGMFVELDNMIEGLLIISDMKDDYYTYDESTFSIKGKKNKHGYRLGDRVRVVLTNANNEAKTIDFAIVPEKKKNEEDN